MRTTTKIICHPDNHGAIEIEMRPDGTTVEIMQGDSHKVWIPRSDIVEFCRVLTEWEAGQ